MNEQPFYIGQKVVALRNGEGIIKGAIYTCAGCFKKICCGEWGIMIKEFPKNPLYNYCATCTNCDGNYFKDDLNYRSGPCKYFAPIEPLYAGMTAAIAAGMVQTSEVPDVREIKEPVKHTS